MGDYAEAEEALLAINNDDYRMDSVYVNWLARWYSSPAFENHQPHGHVAVFGEFHVHVPCLASPMMFVF